MQRIKSDVASTLPPVNADVVIHIPDGQPPIPLRVDAVVEVDDGEGIVIKVTGTVLVGGRYGYGTDAESYVVGEPIVVYVASGDEWEKAA